MGGWREEGAQHPADAPLGGWGAVVRGEGGSSWVPACCPVIYLGPWLGFPGGSARHQVPHSPASSAAIEASPPPPGGGGWARGPGGWGWWWLESREEEDEPRNGCWTEGRTVPVATPEPNGATAFVPPKPPSVPPGPWLSVELRRPSLRRTLRPLGSSPLGEVETEASGS